MRCIIIEDEPIAREVLKDYISKVSFLDLVGEFESVNAYLNDKKRLDLDIIFLDIEMPKIDGLSFAKTLPKSINLIFTTAFREYALEGFELQAKDYLLKPFSFDRFFVAIQKCVVKSSSEKMDEQEMEADFFVKSDRMMKKVRLKEVVYLESLSDYVKIHLVDGKIITREKISHLHRCLPQNRFLRVHRSFVVSLDKMSAYTNEYVQIDDKAFPIGRSYKEIVLERLRLF